ncbi:UDP-3-O-(3-hydroxymyristoyl)glucosamine N-acyltransferase [Mucisphaera sp.]|uniref:UDP-3-O-(3-hydroxymyristoyl)glucosamine N-acyltransferase n=1 Tax=Mucisphaera sp. TaxID=2913024 RepID=UPI003D0D8B5F
MATTTSITITTGELCQQLAGSLRGPDNLSITGLNNLEQAQPGDVTFLTDAKFADRWPASQATALLLTDGIDNINPSDNQAIITVPNADLAMAKALALFEPPRNLPPAGIHRTATVDPTASIDPKAHIGPYTQIGPRVQIAAGAIIHGHAHLYADCQVGEHTELHAGVVLRERTIVGQRSILHASACIGTDGFGYRPDTDDNGQPRIVKIPHIGNVIIGDEAEIGANTCIDRGKFGATTIGNQTKIDNLCQIGHNCTIGNLVIIAGNCGISGSVTIKDGATIAGGVVVRDHITIGTRATVAGAAVVGFDIPDGETWGGFPAQPAKQWFREVANLKHLPDLVKAHRKK